MSVPNILYLHSHDTGRYVQPYGYPVQTPNIQRRRPCTTAAYHAAYEPQRAIRTKRFKYIRRYGDREAPVLPNTDDSPSKDVLLEHGLAERPVAPEQLYDLVFDPNEAGNLAGDPAHAPVLDDLRGRLDAWMARTKDPLLDGDVAPPDGARVNGPDQRSPAEPSETVDGAVPRA